MTKYAGTLHVRAAETGTPLDTWRVECRDRAAQTRVRRLAARAEIAVKFEGAVAVRREWRSWRPDGSLLLDADGKPWSVIVSTQGWRSSPLTALAFRLADAPDLGVFVHVSSSTASLDSILSTGLVDRLEGDAEVPARLGVCRRRTTIRQGREAGTEVEYSFAEVVLS